MIPRVTDSEIVIAKFITQAKFRLDNNQHRVHQQEECATAVSNRDSVPAY